jgi:Deacetylases, including yeast histone deacetylase and acetoin utilization protein
LIAISAGFDGHQGDIVSLGLETKDYNNIGKEIGKLSKPMFFVLEGGYNGRDLGNDIDAFLKGIEI